MKGFSGRTLALAALGGAAALAAPALTGAQTPVVPIATVGVGPAYVQVRVVLAAGTVAEREGQVEAPDASVEDGTGSVLVNSRGASARAGTVTAAGVRVVVVNSGRGPLVRLSTPTRGRFAFLSYHATGGRTLLVRLWRSAPVFPGATRRDDGCLRITSFGGVPGRITARGLELQPLFEHGLVLQVRNAAGRSVGLTPVIAREGTFRPDFSGYSRPGTWSGTVVHRATRPQRGTLQAWVGSARDGSLECLVQVPVDLAPRP